MGGLEKGGRIGRVKERKERGKGREVNKVSCSLPVGALWLVVRVRRRPGTKRSQLQPLGLVHWQANWPLSTPSGHSDSCRTLGNELSEETHVLTKQEILLEKGPRVETSRVREPRRTALPCGSQCLVLW